MAGWQQVAQAHFLVKVSARPRWWRWWWGRHVPYFVGQHPRFAFEVEKAEGNHEDDQVHWALRTGDNEVANGYLAGRGGTFRFEVPGKAKGDVHMPMLDTSGEYTIVIAGERNPSPVYGEGIARVVIGPSAYTFSVVTLEGLIFKVGIPVLFGGTGLIIAGWNLCLNIARGSG